MKSPKKRFFRVLLLILTLSIIYHLATSESITTQPPDSAPANAAPNLPWYLTLVNHESGLPENYHFTLKQVNDGVYVDKRIADSLNDMLHDAQAAGYEVHLNAGYRTSSEQQTLFDEKVATFKNNGYDETTAYGLASQWVSLPGTSEHELGIAVDIGTDTPALYDWLAAESWRYGFIQRYPYEKTNLTGVSHEPWHYRYVGKKAATAIHTRGLCLEEYVAQKRS